MGLTQHQKIVARMVQKRHEQTWFFAKDFMPPTIDLSHAYCVGYEATARFSELANDYPDMIESVKEGKYVKRRIRWATIDSWIWSLPQTMRELYQNAGYNKQQPQQTDQMTILDWGK